MQDYFRKSSELWQYCGHADVLGIPGQAVSDENDRAGSRMVLDSKLRRSVMDVAACAVVLATSWPSGTLVSIYLLTVRVSSPLLSGRSRTFEFHVPQGSTARQTSSGKRKTLDLGSFSGMQSGTVQGSGTEVSDWTTE